TANQNLIAIGRRRGKRQIAVKLGKNQKADQHETKNEQRRNHKNVSRALKNHTYAQSYDEHHKHETLQTGHGQSPWLARFQLMSLFYSRVPLIARRSPEWGHPPSGPPL